MNGQSDRDRMLDDVALSALGILPAADHALVTALILRDAEARAEFDELRPVADLIGLAADEPVDSARSARMKERLMAAVRADAERARDIPARRSTGSVTAISSLPGMMWGTGLAAAAAFVFALVSVIQNFSLRSDLAESQLRVATMQTQVTAEHRAFERDQQMLADLASNDAKRYTVAYGSVVKRGDRVYFAFTSLPALPKGKVYEAWTVPAGSKTVAPSVTFGANSGGITLVPLPENAAKITAVALTVEPEGGSKAPTTKPSFIVPLT